MGVGPDGFNASTNTAGKIPLCGVGGSIRTFRPTVNLLLLVTFRVVLQSKSQRRDVAPG